ncbi:hypothetical protein DQ04_24701000 [Trypanosoma grayi]|uniref:hypothetical protein n=1 Tax=Trypanosoma grayi TaxID=71804 RepID=UPI0004F464E2|nr:hypothetical protein DQ04_24701000 [Trypanosoma grayi]KEG05247.1 hypothetical protein DQ04_24701000 [Trypanosoma grayi]
MKLGPYHICPAVQAFAFVLLVVSMPLTMIRSGDIIPVYTCITFWGERPCSSSGSERRLFRCVQEESSMQACRTFSTISILLSVAIVVLFILRGKYPGSNWAPRIAAILCAITIFFVWSTVVSVYNRKSCRFGDTVFDSYKNYGYVLGVGFSFMIAAWVSEIVVVVLSFVF